MRRKLALFLVLCLCVGLCGCQNSVAEETTTTPVTEPTSLHTEPRISSLEQLCQYVVRNGHYDAKDKCSYIEYKFAANEYYYLIVKDGQLRFWDYASNKTSSSNFYISFECDFSEGKAPRFGVDYLSAKLYNGVAISGTSAKISGEIRDGKVIIYSEDCVSSEASDYIDQILATYDSGVEFIESIMRKAGIPISFEQMMGLS